MSGRARRGALLLALALAGGAPAQAGAAATPADIAVSLDRSAQSARVGSSFTLTATLENRGPAAAPPLTAHLEIIDPTRRGSVDAEDWVRDLNIAVPGLAAGARTRVSWELVPIAPGNFTVYVVSVPESSSRSGGAPVSAGGSAAVAVADARTLSAGGALPVAVATPLLVLGALGLSRARRRGRARRL